MYCYNTGKFTSGTHRAALVGRGGGTMNINNCYYMTRPAWYSYTTPSNGSSTVLAIGDLNSQQMCEQLGEKFKYKNDNGDIFEYPKLYWE